MLQTLQMPVSANRMQQLDSHGPQYGAAVQEEQVPAGPRMLYCALDELDDRLALELGEPAERKVACRIKVI